jgi:hypothetical protein
VCRCGFMAMSIVGMIALWRGDLTVPQKDVRKHTPAATARILSGLEGIGGVL